MIKFTDKAKEIIPLWKEAFGDSEEDIKYFLENAKHAKCLGYYDSDKLVSMLFLVNCELYNYNAEYIYAACTKSEYKGRGYMSKLLDYCKKHYDFLCLIPANDGLINYYNPRGFIRSCDIDYLAFDESKEINEYLLDGYHLTKPQAMFYERNNDGILIFS
jgi:predicted acetyltransferase